jgi:hypothetical protein
MRIHPMDITAGERARAIAMHPETPPPVFDPTDPRSARRPARRAPAPKGAAPTDPTRPSPRP